MATGLNILKTGSDPQLKPDTEYPDWLWKLADVATTARELREKYDSDEGLSVDEAQQLVKLENRTKIRETNITRAKR